MYIRYTEKTGLINIRPVKKHSGENRMGREIIRLARSMKGLEPLIAAIILIAITLVIAIAVAAWILGIFAGTASGGERLKILPNATLNATNGTLSLWIVNEGGSSAKIISIDINAIHQCSSIDPDTIPPGGPTKVTANCSSAAIAAGVTYTVRVITAAGNIYPIPVVATS